MPFLPAWSNKALGSPQGFSFFNITSCVESSKKIVVREPRASVVHELPLAHSLRVIFNGDCLLAVGASKGVPLAYPEGGQVTLRRQVALWSGFETCLPA
jgi:hypothetical protein